MAQTELAGAAIPPVVDALASAAPPVPVAPPTTARPAALVWRPLSSPLLVLGGDLLALGVGMLLVQRVVPATLLYLVVVPVLLALLGSYRRRLTPSIQTDFFPLLGVLASPAFVLAWLGEPEAVHLLRYLPAIAVLVIAGRLISYRVQRAARTRAPVGERTLIVGSGSLGCELAEALLAHPQYGLTPIGFLDGFADSGRLPLPHLGAVRDIHDAIQRTGVRRVIVAYGSDRGSELAEVLRESEQAHVEVHILPRLFELGVTPAGPDTDFLWGFPLQRARRAALRTPAWRTKRVMDVVISGAILAVTAPILGLAALAVKLSSRGPVFFRQRRVGQRGQVVEILKLRSMRVNDEADVRWGTRDDDRVTRVGAFLRASSLDELPQLINVLRGDMSLVGPRPERPVFAQQFDQNVSRYRERLRVPVGLTGWAQVHGLRGDTSIAERARFDNYYIEHWSVWFDVVILARTFAHVISELSSEMAGLLRRGAETPTQ